MKSLITVFYLSLFTSICLWGQNPKNALKYSFSILNGISNQDEGDDQDVAYVNAFRLQMAIAHTQKYSSVFGLQYGKNGSTTNWTCGTDWDYCEILGVPPLEFESIERKHYLSLFYNSRFTFHKKFYLQGGLSWDFPIKNEFFDKYEDSTGEKSKERNVEIYGRKIRLNTTIGANAIFGKEFSISERWDCFLELEYKMYNLITKRFDDYEDYFFEKNQRPWVLGINVGLSFH